MGIREGMMLGLAIRQGRIDAQERLDRLAQIKEELAIRRKEIDVHEYKANTERQKFENLSNMRDIVGQFLGGGGGGAGMPAPSGGMPPPSGGMPAPSGGMPAPSGGMPPPSGGMPAPSGGAAPAAQAPAPAVDPNDPREQDRGRLRLLEAQRARYETLLNNPVTAQMDMHEETRGAMQGIRSNYGRILEDIQRINQRMTRGSSELEGVTGKPLPYVTDEEARRGYQKIQEQREAVSARQGEAAGMRQALGQERAAEIAAAAERRKAKLGYDAQMAKPLEATDRTRLEAMGQALDVAEALSTEFTPEERRQYVGAFGLRIKAKGLQEGLKELLGEQADPKFARFVALMNMGLTELFGDAGKAVSGIEKDLSFGYLLSGGEMTAEAFEGKLQLSRNRLPARIERLLRIATTPARDLTPDIVRGKRGTKETVQKTLPPLTDDEIKNMSTEELQRQIDMRKKQ